MANKKFQFNPETLNYEEVETSVGSVIGRTLLMLGIGILIGIGFFFLFFSIFPSPNDRLKDQQIKNLTTQYEVLNKQIDQMQLLMIDLQQRDDNLYRVLLEADPIPNSLRFSIATQTNYYDEILQQTNSQLASNLTRKVDQLEKSIYVQSNSYDEIVRLAQTNEERMKHLPSIQPILNKDLRRIASGFGYRIDPIYRTPRFHAGMDFTAPQGTEIYATGNGKVSYAGWKQGYGNCVIIDHGYGYETLYAHMYKVNVRQGQSVTRSEIIGFVGSTGKSTGPHCHYEVHYKKKVVDPRNYYFQDLSPEDYDRMVQLSDNFGQTLD